MSHNAQTAKRYRRRRSSWSTSAFVGALLSVSLFGLCTTRSEEAIFSAHEGSFHHSGLFAYEAQVGQDAVVRVLKLGKGKSEELFSVKTKTGTHPPICMRQSLVITETGGRVSKYDLQGKLIYSTDLKPFDGASKQSGRIKDELIFVTKTSFVGGVPKDEILIVSTSGKEPVVKRALTTKRIAKVNVGVNGELVISGPEGCDQLTVTP